MTTDSERKAYSLEGALTLSEGLTSVVGAGGKKTTLYTLASRLQRAVITATVRIPIFDSHVADVSVTNDPATAARTAEDWPLGLVPEREGNRYRGYEPETVDDLAASGVADAVLVKADGARTRWLKAPNEREPQIPSTADTVIPIASARVVGKSLSAEHVHRPERVAAITGLDVGEKIRPADVATVVTSERGGFKDIPPDATVVPLVNMVDDAQLASIGREIAEEILDRRDVSRVVLARMIDDDPIVDVVD